MRSAYQASLAFDDAEDLVLAHDQELSAVQFDLLAGVLAEEHRVAWLHIKRRDGAVILDLAFACGDDFPLLGLLFRGVGDDDSANNLLGFLEPLNDDAVVERANFRLP